MSTKTQPKRLTREDVFAAADRATEDVEVPEWGGTITVRALSGTERDKYEASMVRYRRNAQGGVEIESVETDNLRARLVSQSAVDEEGNRLFKEADVLGLRDKSAAALDRVFQAAQRLSHLTERDVEALKTGLKAVPSGSSGFASPETSP